MVDASQMPHHLGPAANVLNGMGDMFVMGGKEISNCLFAPSSISADGVTSVKDQTTLNLLAGVALDNKARASMMSRNESHFDPRLFAPHGKRGRFTDGIDPTRGLVSFTHHTFTCPTCSVTTCYTFRLCPPTRLKVSSRSFTITPGLLQRSKLSSADGANGCAL